MSRSVTPTTIAVSTLTCCLPRVAEFSVVHHHEKSSQRSEKQLAHGQSTYTRLNVVGSSFLESLTNSARQRKTQFSLRCNDGWHHGCRESTSIPRKNPAMETQFRAPLPFQEKIASQAVEQSTPPKGTCAIAHPLAVAGDSSSVL